MDGMNRKIVLLFLVIGRKARLHIIMSINQVADHSVNVLENAMIIYGIDLSVHNCVVSIQTQV